MKDQKVIAIDGPAGAGKSTVAKKVAEKLNYIYIDTGAMYRAVTLKALNQGVALSDVDAIVELAENTDIKFIYGEKGNQRVIMDGQDVSEAIRTPLVTNNVSEVAAIPGVRHAMVKLQREMAANQGTVMDGRDIASYVLPNADFKFFLTASPEIRAARRQKDLFAQGFEVSLEQLTREIIERDRKDSQREMAPLTRVPEAELIDTSNITADQVVDLIISRVLEGDKP
ncbi:(d)CMP kinase [Thermincola potens]|uniref:Cytidylate kinase n=1 Tax=Thermincola potens (strain JR) TaxID=635013 RepID=D5XFM3_THEPJ|nr:(d)CMP kinase [Thermincola potens]ADG82444.1 cytidylate kinase [Thermincola potens JR]